MSLDRLTVDAYFAEIGPRLAGKRIEKLRPHGKWSLRAELSSRDSLFIDASRSLAGFWLCDRVEKVIEDTREVVGPSRTAALLFKKHLEGARIGTVRRGPSLVLTLETSRCEVRLQTQGVPSAILITSENAVARFGPGETAPMCDAEPLVSLVDRETALRLIEKVGAASREDRRRFLSEFDPDLLPLLRRWPASLASRRGLADLIAGERPARAFLSPPLSDDASNLAKPPALIPFAPDEAGGAGEDTFASAAITLYAALRRADLFQERVQIQTARRRAELGRLTRLKAALERDRGRWPDPSSLRLQAEALLAAPPDFLPPKGRDRVVISIPSPRGEGSIDALIQPALSLPQNANAFYAKARAIERQQTAFEERWTGVIASLAKAESGYASVTSIRSLDDFSLSTQSVATVKASGDRPRYLTSRGLEIIFGRSAAENHDVTFKLAKREDLWFHVLDAPGGHVVLRNREGRANHDDIAEAAALAAFLSERRDEARVDVQYTERKHVHPSGGGKGRVRAMHSEVVRVAPKDPAGRLRAR